MARPDVNPTYFATPAAFRAWLKKNHAKAAELWVGFHKRGTGTPSITWPESVDEALCFGWIDGVRYSVDDDRYMIRFTPRRPGSVWSAVNLRKMKTLMADRRVAAAGEAIYKARDPKKSHVYSFDRKKPPVFPPAFLRRFKANTEAWAFYSSQPPWYQRVATHWVTSAKKDETRERRFSTLLADCAAGRRIRGVSPAKKQ